MRRKQRLTNTTPVPTPEPAPTLGRNEIVMIARMFGPESMQPLGMEVRELDAAYAAVQNIRRWVQAQAAALTPQQG